MAVTTEASAKVMAAREVFAARERGEVCELIDVRTPVEHRAVHAVGARLVPLDRLDPKAVVEGLPAERRSGTIYLLCKSGGRATKAAQKFAAAGIGNVCVVEGGTDAWVAAGLPCERGQAAMSLERQVRIAAGLLVVAGAVLALTVSPWFVLLSGFVGAGLVFAGVTDFCGMGMMLARAPWNQVKDGGKGSCGGGCC